MDGTRIWVQFVCVGEYELWGGMENVHLEPLKWDIKYEYVVWEVLKLTVFSAAFIIFSSTVEIKWKTASNIEQWCFNFILRNS